MLQEYRRIFGEYLSAYQKAEAVQYALGLVESQKVSIPELYEEVITPSLNSILVCDENKNDTIWREHLMTNIARTVVENCYPYVLDNLARANSEGTEPAPSVVILCPEEEYHDIGGRMAADFFALENFKVQYVGANTPLQNVLSVCIDLQPDVLAFSASNFYYIPLIKETVADVKKLPKPPYVIASGSALLRTNLTAEQIGCDQILHTYAQIKTLKESLIS